jgi:hypothetical protein
MKLQANRYAIAANVVAGVLLVGSAIALLDATQEKHTNKAKAPTQAANLRQKPPVGTPQKTKLQIKKREYAKTDTAGAPEIALSVNCLQESLGIAGKAILIEAGIWAASKEGGFESVSLSKPGAYWGELLSLEIRNKQGDLVAGLTPRLTSQGEPSIELDGEKYGWVVWVLEPASAANLVAGEYQLRAKIDTEGDSGTGWKGRSTSPPAMLKVVAPTDSVSADERRIVALSGIRIERALGRLSEALAQCDQFLAGNASDALVLQEKGDTLVMMGKFKEAVSVYDAALSLERKLEEGAVPEPPVVLMEKRTRAAAEAKKSS